MKYLPLLLLLLVVSCGEEDPSPENCQITTVKERTNGIETVYTYTYDDSGKMIKETQSAAGLFSYDRSFTYTPDGKLDKVQAGNYYLSYEYNPDGKIAMIKTYAAGTNEMVFVDTYTWSGNKLEIKYSFTEQSNPIQLYEYEFLDGNVVTSIVKTYTGAEPNRYTNLQVIHYEDFDTAPSLSNASSGSAKANDMRFSKHNPRRATIHEEMYNPDGSTIFPNVERSETYTYTYSRSKAVLTSHAATDGSPIDWEVTYNNCK